MSVICALSFCYICHGFIFGCGCFGLLRWVGEGREAGTAKFDLSSMRYWKQKEAIQDQSNYSHRAVFLFTQVAHLNNSSAQLYQGLVLAGIILGELAFEGFP